MDDTSASDIEREARGLDWLASIWTDRWRHARWEVVQDEAGRATACFDAVNITPDGDRDYATRVLCYFEQTVGKIWRAMSPQGWVVLAEAATLADLIVLMDDSLDRPGSNPVIAKRPALRVLYAQRACGDNECVG